jgi:hypothetical protein
MREEISQPQKQAGLDVGSLRGSLDGMPIGVNVGYAHAHKGPTAISWGRYVAQD